MISDLAYISKSFFISNQVKSWPIYLSSLEITSLYTRRSILFS